MLDADFIRQVAALSLESLICRNMRHSWKDAQRFLNVNGYSLFTVCRECGTYREKVMEGGQIIRIRMVYPQDYLLKGLGPKEPEMRKYIFDQWVNTVPIVSVRPI